MENGGLTLLWSLMLQQPPLALAVVLTLGVAFVNGWTDAPNTITAAVSSGALSFRRAALLAAGCSLLGSLLVIGLHAGVARTISSIAVFPAEPHTALTALSAAMAAVILWGTAAWLWGLPTSESHALISALSGAALALGSGPEVLNPWAWGRVLAGLLLSTGVGFGAARLLWTFLPAAGRKRQYRRLQILSAAVMSVLHGAQDGQKFMGVLLLCLSLALGQGGVPSFHLTPGIALLCAVTMGLGVCLGGKRIVHTIGIRLVQVDLRQGAAADLAGICCLAAATALGLPVSTTHTKTAAIWGAGTAGRTQGADRGTLSRLWLAWLLTLPCCALLGWLLTVLMTSLI